MYLHAINFQIFMHMSVIITIKNNVLLIVKHIYD